MFRPVPELNDETYGISCMDPPVDGKKYLTQDEAAERIGITVSQLLKLKDDEQIKGYEDGANWRFVHWEVARLAVRHSIRKLL